MSVDSLRASVQASSQVQVSAPSVSVDAAVLSVNGALATFAGVLQCQTLIATAVVSPSYTPGVGNLL